MTQKFRNLLSLLIILTGVLLAIGSSDSGTTVSTKEPPKEECDWCGGIGRVGYSGKSKEQCDRTGMGRGNSCSRCGGTGYLKK